MSGHSDPQPVLDVVDYLRDRNLTLRWKLETHAHVRAGHFPEPEDNGTSYIKIPLDAF